MMQAQFYTLIFNSPDTFPWENKIDLNKFEKRTLTKIINDNDIKLDMKQSAMCYIANKF